MAIDERAGVRDRFLTIVRQLLYGPFEPEEVIPSATPDVDPSDFYLTGLLWPRDTAVTASDDDASNVQDAAGANLAAADDAPDVGAPLFSMYKPSSIGITASVEDPAAIAIVARAARYRMDSRADGTVVWKRSPILREVKVAADESRTEWKEKYPEDMLAIHVRLRRFGSQRIVTATLMNDAPRPEFGRSGATALFQTCIAIRATGEDGSGRIVARRADAAVPDDDLKSGDLLFRNRKEFASGHSVAATWEEPVDEMVVEARTDWIPERAVLGVLREGHPSLKALRDRKPNVFAAGVLAESKNRAAAIAGWVEFHEVYSSWIEAEAARAATLPTHHTVTAETHLAQCRIAADRIGAGIRLLEKDDTAWRAFTWANEAMAEQFEAAGRGALVWAPFQLAFFLLALPGIADPSHEDRDTLDLLWFPTGGGKTEAYLGIALFAILHRRLKGKPGGHVDAIMRYTLRLLTVQQFQRAAAVICRAELIRRRHPGELGREPVSIGLYVGQGATPNKVLDGDSSARKMLDETTRGGTPDCTPRLLTECPLCKGPLPVSCYSINTALPAVEIRCANEECPSFQTPLPVYTVDEDLYRVKPSLVIATIDKFAQLPRSDEPGKLFGGPHEPPPDLIIQDELHLISGPLGTVAGLYETIIDFLCCRPGSKPKIIGSTATIGGAGRQTKALFDRGLLQFPPPAVDADDSFFAITGGPIGSDRRYVGITSAGRSPKFLLLTVAAAAHTASQALKLEGVADKLLDPYWTLLMYFNSLRELAGAAVMMRDDVPRSAKFLASRLGIGERPLEGEAVELTSRVSSPKIPDVLKRLEQGLGGDPNHDEPVDTVLASNMISVGIDIPRLGLMVVNGQPKTTAEYIQATSRIGRGLPGLAIVLVNASRPRDVSHFEHFAHFHDTLYRRVEVTSVTPWSHRARDRALHAVVVGTARHRVSGLATRFGAVNFDPDAPEFQAILTFIRERASRAGHTFVNQEDLAAELDRIVERWERRARQHREAGKKLEYWATLQPFNHKPTQDHLLRSAEEPAADPEVWLTPNSMREVEPSAVYIPWQERS